MQTLRKISYPAPRRLLPERVRAIEHLDRSDTDPAERACSYQDLERIARLPFQFEPLAGAVLGLANREPRAAGPLRLLELGAGTGAVGRRLARRLARAGRSVELCLTDMDPTFLPAPLEGDRVKVTTLRLDVLRDPLPATDIAYANLLIHHLDDADAVNLLRKMREASRLGGVVYDLDRNRWAFALLKALFPLWARSPITVADSLISVQQAFRPGELLAMAREAGIESPRVKSFFRVRSLLAWASSGPAG